MHTDIINIMEILCRKIGKTVGEDSTNSLDKYYHIIVCWFTNHAFQIINSLPALLT